MVDIKTALTRKLGPLPAWAWGGVAAGGIWLYRIYVRGQTTEQGGQTFDLGSSVGLTPTVSGGGPSPYGSAPFEQVTGTQGGLLSFGTAGGAYGSVEGPFDFVERLLSSQGFGSIIQPPIPAPTRNEDGTTKVATPPAPATATRVPVRQPPPIDQGIAQSWRNAVISAYQLEGVKPTNSAGIDRIALELKQGRTVTNLRSSIRNNERLQGRTTVAQSRAYWGNR